MKFGGRKDGQFRSGGLLVGDRPFSLARTPTEKSFDLLRSFLCPPTKAGRSATRHYPGIN